MGVSVMAGGQSGKGRQVIFISLILLSLFLLFPKTNEQPVQGKQGMVSSAHPIATQAGLRILKRGGNAFDAAVAVAATLNVVEPMMSGIGGYGTILIFDSKKKRVEEAVIGIKKKWDGVRLTRASLLGHRIRDHQKSPEDEPPKPGPGELGGGIT